MKKVFSLLLAVLMLVSALPVAYATETQDYSLGTAVVYTADEEANENWTVTVPAKLAPGGNGPVTLEGYWPSTKTITVTAQESVVLTNSINANDTKTLAVDFRNGISAAGSNTEKQKFTETVSVAAITNALFGTWDGHFYYTVKSAITPVLEGDGQVFFTALPETLSFRSTAPMSEFQEVQVNGETVDPSNYTVTEGSTIITLHEDYLMTLGAESHQITVVSDSGSPSAGFTVRDITYENGEYTYTIMQDGFETLEEARAYARVLFQNQIGIPLDDWAASMNFDEDTKWWACEAYCGGIGGLRDSTFVPNLNPTRFWAFVVKDKTQSTYMNPCETLLGHPVRFANNAYTDCSNLTSPPHIPSSVTDMYQTFRNCTSLVDAPTIPAGITKLFGTFKGCLFSSVDIPGTVTAMGEHVFANCTNLTSIKFGGSVDDWNAIIFDGNNTSEWNLNCGEITVTCTDGTVIVPAYGS